MVGVAGRSGLPLSRAADQVRPGDRDERDAVVDLDDIPARIGSSTDALSLIAGRIRTATATSGATSAAGTSVRLSMPNRRWSTGAQIARRR